MYVCSVDLHLTIVYLLNSAWENLHFDAYVVLGNNSTHLVFFLMRLVMSFGPVNVIRVNFTVVDTLKNLSRWYIRNLNIFSPEFIWKVIFFFSFRAAKNNDGIHTKNSHLVTNYNLYSEPVLSIDGQFEKIITPNK